MSGIATFTSGRGLQLIGWTRGIFSRKHAVNQNRARGKLAGLIAGVASYYAPVSIVSGFETKGAKLLRRLWTGE